MEQGGKHFLICCFDGCGTFNSSLIFWTEKQPVLKFRFFPPGPASLPYNTDNNNAIQVSKEPGSSAGWYNFMQICALQHSSHLNAKLLKCFVCQPFCMLTAMILSY